MEQGRAIAAFSGGIDAGPVCLRVLAESDTDALLPHFADWDVVRWLARPAFPVHRPAFADFVAGVAARQEAGAALDLAILTPEGPGGVISWRAGTASPVQAGEGPNIGFWLGRAFWGRGWMTAAARALVAHILVATGAGTVYAGAFDGNGASLRVQEKLGFRLVGRAMVWCNPRQEMLPHLNTALEPGAGDRTTR